VLVDYVLNALVGWLRFAEQVGKEPLTGQSCASLGNNHMGKGCCHACQEDVLKIMCAPESAVFICQ
jgi:hypothetical protein